MEQKSLLFKESLVLSTELHLFTWTTKVESGSHRVTRAEECLHLGKESYAKSWFRVYKVCIIGRAKRSQQHPVFQGGQPTKYLMTGLNIVYLQWSDENWCQCDMAVDFRNFKFFRRQKYFVIWILKVNHWQATTESSKNFVQPALYVSWYEYSVYQAFYPKYVKSN